MNMHNVYSYNIMSVIYNFIIMHRFA